MRIRRSEPRGLTLINVQPQDTAGLSHFAISVERRKYDAYIKQVKQSSYEKTTESEKYADGLSRVYTHAPLFMDRNSRAHNIRAWPQRGRADITPHQWLSRDPEAASPLGGIGRSGTHGLLYMLFGP